MKHTLLITLATLLVAPLAGRSAAVPQIISASDPVRPDEAVLVIGEGFDPACSIELGPLADGPATGPQTNASPAVQHWETIQPLQTNGRALKFVVPKAWPQGAWV